MKRPDKDRSNRDRRRPDPADFENAIGDTFRSLVENSFDVIEIVDSDFVVKYVSPSVRHVLGYQPPDMVGQSVLDYFHPDDVPKVRNVLQFVLKTGGRSPYVDVRVRHIDGSWRVVENVVQNLVDHPVIGGIVLNYRDITDRVRTNEALRRSEQRYHKAFSASPDSITISSIADGHFLEVNEGFERISGFRRDEIIGKSALELGIWPDRPSREKLIQKLSRDGSARDFKTNLRARDGTRRVCLISAELIELDDEQWMLAITRDITEQERAREQLRVATEQLRTDHEELLEKNIALKQILAHIEDEKAQYRHELATQIENLLTPIIATLKDNDGRLTPQDIEKLEAGLRRIIEEDLDEFQNSLSKLTPREQDICELVRKGRSSKEIAEELGVSPQTIHKHRQEIRRKLQLTNKEINLAAYLRSK